MEEPAASTTTREEDRASAEARSADALAAVGAREATALAVQGQVRINRLWEVTQASLAVMAPAATFGLAGYLVVYGSDALQASALTFMTGTTSLIIGFYFSRTNHTRTGGVGTAAEKRRGE